MNRFLNFKILVLPICILVFCNDVVADGVRFNNGISIGYRGVRKSTAAQRQTGPKLNPGKASTSNFLQFARSYQQDEAKYERAYLRWETRTQQQIARQRQKAQKEKAREEMRRKNQQLKERRLAQQAPRSPRFGMSESGKASAAKQSGRDTQLINESDKSAERAERPSFLARLRKMFTGY